MTTVQMNATLSIEPFDAAITNIKRWLQRLDGAFKLFRATDADKVPCLLHCVGIGAFEVLCNRCEPDDPYKRPYATLIAKLKELSGTS